MTDKDSNHSGGWMVEVMATGPGDRHKRYLVNVSTRDVASAVVQALLGGGLQINAVTPVSGIALEAANLGSGQVMAI